MLHLPVKIAALTLAALAFFSPLANAITLPVLSIDNNTGDAGVVSDGTTLTINAHALGIETNPSPLIGFIDFIPDEPFTLTANVSTGSSLGGGNWMTGPGTLQVGTGGSLLSASFTSLALINAGSGTGNLMATLTYTGGSLAGAIGSGELIGGFVVGTCTGAAAGCDFSQAFSAQNITGTKVGAVVPVPAAVWLFGSGLLGLVGIARRKAA
jgi:hypothetical protein